MSLSYNTVGGVVSQLRDDGWKEDMRKTLSTGQGYVLEHPSKRGKITIFGPDEQILGPKAIASILSQAGIVPR